MNNNPTPKAEHMGLARLHNRAKRLMDVIEMDAPSVVIANEVLLIWKAAILACGPDLFNALSHWQIKIARDEAGLCQHCDTEITADLTYPPVCEQCDAKIEDESNGSDPPTLSN